MEVTARNSFDLAEVGILSQKGLEIEEECVFLLFKSEPSLHGV